MNQCEYEVTAKGSQTDERILANAITTLMHHGFRLERRTDNEAELTGPGLTSTKQDPLLGASRVRLQSRDCRLRVNAELGGVQTMRRFLIWFPLILGLTLGLVFSVVGGLVLGQQDGPAPAFPWRWLWFGFGTALLPVSPWLILSPLMIRWIARRTKNAIETLAHNATLA